MAMSLKGTMRRKHDQCVKHLITLERYVSELEEFSRSRLPELTIEYLEISDTCSEIKDQILKLKEQI